jgi:hypothetical protein
LLAEYRRRYATIYDRADLYVPFFERGLQLLADDGRLAFICANRWLKNKYGGPLRGLIARDFASRTTSTWRAPTPSIPRSSHTRRSP